jgi:hypothetical protein
LSWATRRALGEREAGTERLGRAVEAYHREALTVWMRERASLGWAKTQNNLGLALSALSEREGGAASREEAVTAFREALKEYSRDAAPYWRGVAQGNLGRVEALMGADPRRARAQALAAR